MQQSLRTPRHETIHSFHFPLLDHSEKMDLLRAHFHTCYTPICSRIEVHARTEPFCLRSSDFGSVEQAFAKPDGSKSLSSFPAQAACCAHNLYLEEHLCRHSPKITLPIDVGRQDLKAWLQTPKARQTASSRFGLQPGVWARLLNLYCACIIPYHTIPLAVARIITTRNSQL
jgi:hypothetical protein